MFPSVIRKSGVLVQDNNFGFLFELCSDHDTKIEEPSEIF